MNSVFTVDAIPRSFIVESLTAGQTYSIGAQYLTDEDKTFKITQALISVDGDNTTDVKYRIDPDASDAPHLGHQLEDGDEIMLRNPAAIRNFRLYCTTAGASGTLRITLMG